MLGASSLTFLEKQSFQRRFNGMVQKSDWIGFFIYKEVAIRELPCLRKILLIPPPLLISTLGYRPMYL